MFLVRRKDAVGYSREWSASLRRRCVAMGLRFYVDTFKWSLCSRQFVDFGFGIGGCGSYGKCRCFRGAPYVAVESSRCLLGRKKLGFALRACRGRRQAVWPDLGCMLKMIWKKILFGPDELGRMGALNKSEAAGLL